MIHRIIRACLFDGNLYYELADDPGATSQAFVVVLLGGLAVSIGLVFGAAIGYDLSGYVLITVRSVSSAICSWFIIGLFATGIGRLLRRKTRLSYMLTSLGFARAPELLSIVLAVAYFSEALALFFYAVILVWVTLNVARGVSRTIDMPFSVGLWIGIVGLIIMIQVRNIFINVML